MTSYLLTYFGAAILALVTTPIVIRLARRLSILDVPGARHMHAKPIPRTGGVAIFLPTMLLAMVLLLFGAENDQPASTVGKVVVMLCAGAFVFFVGLIDDVKSGGLPVKTRLLAQIAAAGLVCAVGIRAQTITITEGLTLDLGLFSWPLTILWIVGITNAINFSDGLDGLAAGISAVACSVIAIFAIYSGQTLMAALVLALLGSLSGFLFFNFNPAKIFMGDCGSTFLGFTIASASVMCSVKSATFVGIALPVLALGIPIFDTLFSILRRIIERRSMFAPDRRHFHHRLVEMGLKQRHAVIAIYVMTSLFTGLGMFMIVTRNIGSLTIFFCIVLLLLLTFHAVGLVRPTEVMAGLQEKYSIRRQAQREVRNFEQAQLLFHNARTFDSWWAALCEVAGRMDFVWLCLKTTDEQGMIRTRIWRKAEGRSDVAKVVLMTVPLPCNGLGTLCEFEMAISVNGSYESAGRRATLFSRVIDKHEIVYDRASTDSLQEPPRMSLERETAAELR